MDGGAERMNVNSGAIKEESGDDNQELNPRLDALETRLWLVVSSAFG